MTRKWIISICLLMFSNTTPATDTITLNTTGNPPLNTNDMRGFMDVVASTAFGKINITLKTVHLPAERGLKNANLGIEDGEMSRIEGINKLYPNLIMVPEKIMDWQFVAFSKQDIKLDHGWQDLTNFNVAYINGWKILEKNTTHVRTTKVKNATLLFNLLESDRTDIALYEKWGGLLIIGQNHNTLVKLAVPPLEEKAMYIYLNKKHKNIVDPLASALKTMKADGSYNKLVREILSPLLETPN